MSQLQSVKKHITEVGATVASVACSDVTAEFVKKLEYDLIFFTLQSDDEECEKALKTLNSEHVPQEIPVFILTSHTDRHIKEALCYGAADYITPDEDTESIMAKVNAVLNGSEVSGGAVIDITPPEVSVTTKGIKVFVVEDDPLLRNLLSIRLERSNFPYEFSTDGKQALAAMKQFKPDVIILDLMLPGISGFEVLEQVKESQELRSVPVIVFSNKDGQEDRKRAADLGAAAFHVKAMTDLAELITKIQEIVKK